MAWGGANLADAGLEAHEQRRDVFAAAAFLEAVGELEADLERRLVAEVGVEEEAGAGAADPWAQVAVAGFLEFRAVIKREGAEVAQKDRPVPQAAEKFGEGQTVFGLNDPRASGAERAKR